MTTARHDGRAALRPLVLLGLLGLLAVLTTASSLFPSASSGAAGGFAYVANCGSNDVSVLDLSSNTVIETIPVGTCPWGVRFTPNGEKAYVTNHGASTVSVIDTATHTEIDTDGNPGNGSTRIPVGTNARGLDVAPDGTRVYVAGEGSQDVWIIDTATDNVVGTFTHPSLLYPRLRSSRTVARSGSAAAAPTTASSDSATQATRISGPSRA